MSYPDYRFFVEGDEEVFLNQFVKNSFGNISFDTVNVGGWTKIPLVKNQFEEITDNGGQNIVVFDADNDVEKRRDEINKLLERHKLKAEIFLFPDDENIGDFEKLLEQLAVQDHLVLFDCFDSYQKCLEAAKMNYQIPNQKTKIYSYLESLSENPKPKERNYLSEYWDLECDALKPLKAFITNIIN